MNKAEGIMSVPPTLVTGLSLAGVSLQDWVYAATLIWLTTQFGWFVYRRYQDFKNRNKK